MHDSVIKNIAVFANKTLLEILLVGINIYLTMGEHTSIAYTDLKIYIGNIETAEDIFNYILNSNLPFHLVSIAYGCKLE